MGSRRSIAQARKDLTRAREEAAARFHEWAVLLAKEAAEEALLLVIEAEGDQAPATDELGVLARRAFPQAAEDEALIHSAERIDELHEPAQVDVETASEAELEGGSSDYVDAAGADEVIRSAERILDACAARLDG